MSTWTEIERAAYRQGQLSRKSVEVTPLELGQRVAWAEYANARTDGFSPVHRVALADGPHPETYCGEPIPEPVCRLDLAVWPSDLEECPWCRVAYGNVRWRMSA